ncbi:unnamed protein product [Sphacelaria rigidula]
MPHPLLHGPPLSGKTSAVLAITRQFYGGTVLSSSSTRAIFEPWTSCETRFNSSKTGCYR